MFKLCLITIVFFSVQSPVFGQCATSNALWLNGENDGLMKDTGLIGGSVMVYASTTGTMSSGRPLYRTTSSTWKGLSYGGLQIWRAYSSIGSNFSYYKLDTPLDSNFIHIRVDNIRGDFPNLESQSVRGFLNGSAVAASFKDPVNGATNSGNTILGGSSTSTTVQSAMRVFFHSAVDSIVIQQTSFSDWIIAELMIECNFLLPATMGNFSAEKNEASVQLFWNTGNGSIPKYFEVERSSNGAEFYTIKKLASVSNIVNYSSADDEPLNGKNFYRLKKLYEDGHVEYSRIVTIDWKSSGSVSFSIYPNPAASTLFVQVENNLTTLFAYGIDGRRLTILKPGLRQTQVDVSSWPRGEYLIRAEGPAGSATKKLFLR